MTFDLLPRLRVCDACARHVFATETSCPFCAAALVPVRLRPRVPLNRQLSRAQRVALASAVAGLIGCSDSHTPVTAIPVYGAPIPPIAGSGGVGSGGVGSGGSPMGVGGNGPDTGGMGGGGIGGIGGTGVGGDAGGAPSPMYGGGWHTDVDAGHGTGEDAGDDDGGHP